MDDRELYIGSFTGARGRGRGISRVRHDLTTGSLTADGLGAVAESPAFLALHPDGRHLYAVNAVADATVAAYEIRASGQLLELGHAAAGGERPSHLVVHPDGHHVLVANFGSGSVSVLRLGPDGRLGAATCLVQHEGSGPLPQQRGPHVHQVVVDTSGEYVFATDLGADAIVTYHFDGRAGALRTRSVHRVPPGTGPRHLVASHDRVHVIGQLSATVMTFTCSDGVLEQSDVVASATTTDEVLPSELVLSADGQHLFVANRGPDVITTFAIDDNRIRPVAEVASGGRAPRHMALAGRALYVANERSDCLTVLPVTEDGMPGPPTASVAVLSPTCVLPRG